MAPVLGDADEPLGAGVLGDVGGTGGSVSISPASLAFAGQAIAFSFTLAVQAGGIVFQGQALDLTQQLSRQFDRYPYCGRSGFRLPLSQLVEDGSVRGMFVDRRWADEPHPQDYPQMPGPDGGAKGRPAPSQDPVEAYEQVELVIEGQTYEV